MNTPYDTLFYGCAILSSRTLSHRVIYVVGSTSLFTLRSGAVFFSPLNCDFISLWVAIHYYDTSRV